MNGRGAFLAVALAAGGSGCFAFRDHWPENAPLTRSADGPRPSLSVALLVQRRGAAPEPNPSMFAGLAAERVARVLRSTDLFLTVVEEPAIGDWRARVVVRLSPEDDPTAVELRLEGRGGALVFEGEERADAVDHGGDDPVPDVLRSLLRRAESEGAFRAAGA